MRSSLYRPILAAFAVLFLCLTGTAQNTIAVGPGVLHTRELIVTASVVGIDEAARTMTLQGSQGDVVMVAVDSSVRNFGQIKVGDTVKVTYFEAVAIMIMKPEEVTTPISITSVHVAPLDQKPGMVTVKTEEDSVVIESVDYDKRLLTIQMPDGAKVLVDVDPSVKNFASIKAGDHIVVHRTRAVAISVHEGA